MRRQRAVPPVRAELDPQRSAMNPSVVRSEAAPTDEEAFYQAQKEAFADLKARNRARPRRKL